MKIVVLDLELTQNQNSQPKIIQIGAATMNIAGKAEPIDTFSETSNPGELPDAFITELTGITAEAVLAAMPLADVLTAFWQWFERQKVGSVIYQWGEGDLRQLLEASRALGVTTPARVGSFNIKQFVSIFRAARGQKKRGGLKPSMDIFGVPFLGRQHDALADAVAAGHIMRHLYRSIQRTHAIEQMFLTDAKNF